MWIIVVLLIIDPYIGTGLAENCKKYLKILIKKVIGLSSSVSTGVGVRADVAVAQDDAGAALYALVVLHEHCAVGFGDGCRNAGGVMPFLGPSC